MRFSLPIGLLVVLVLIGRAVLTVRIPAGRTNRLLRPYVPTAAALLHGKGVFFLVHVVNVRLRILFLKVC